MNVVKVRCRGRMHRIGFTPTGAAVLFDHDRAGVRDALAELRLVGGTCRCVEVLAALRGLLSADRRRTVIDGVLPRHHRHRVWHPVPNRWLRRMRRRPQPKSGSWLVSVGGEAPAALRAAHAAWPVRLWLGRSSAFRSPTVASDVTHRTVAHFNRLPAGENEWQKVLPAAQQSRRDGTQSFSLAVEGDRVAIAPSPGEPAPAAAFSTPEDVGRRMAQAAAETWFAVWRNELAYRPQCDRQARMFRLQSALIAAGGALRPDDRSADRFYLEHFRRIGIDTDPVRFAWVVQQLLPDLIRLTAAMDRRDELARAAAGGPP